MFDETPNDPVKVGNIISTTSDSNAIYGTHVGKVMAIEEDKYKEQVDTSQYRYKIYIILYLTSNRCFSIFSYHDLDNVVTKLVL